MAAAMVAIGVVVVVAAVWLGYCAMLLYRLCMMAAIVSSQDEAVYTQTGQLGDMVPSYAKDEHKY